MSTRHRVRNILPPLYGLVCVVGLLVGAFIPFVIVGAMAFAIAWTFCSGSPSPNPERRARREAARAHRRA